MTGKINASDAMLKVIEDWGVKQIFGLPGGSIDSTMNALHNRQSTLEYIQVRHEEVGALAAVGQTKVTGQIGVVFGSAGPGAIHLLNGLYDAQKDHVPLLVLVGQVGTGAMNTAYFQEMNENPFFADVAVYNRTIMTAEQMPAVIDEAIRQAYQNNGVAVVTIPTDLGWKEIDDNYVSSANLYQKELPPDPELGRVDQAIAILRTAKRPIMYVGQGARGGTAEILALSERLALPIVVTALAKDIVPDNYPANMGSAGRVATKSGVEVARAADAVLFLGSDFPFQKYFLDPDAKYIQVDTDVTKFGRRHKVDVAIRADARKTARIMAERASLRKPDAWYKAAVANRANWNAWIQSFGDAVVEPLRIEPIFKQINTMATPDAIFQVDVGNVTINGVRYLDTSEDQRWTTSGWYATMGYALPAAIGAQTLFPERQVWSISGDGGFSMVMQDIITQVKYNLPIINVILSNESFGFIEAEQDDTRQPHSGVSLLKGVEYGTASAAMGATGYEVRTLPELRKAFAEAQHRTGPVVINVHTNHERPIPVEQLVLDKEVQGAEEVAAFVKKYHAEGLIPFRILLEQAAANEAPAPELGD